ncbi:MAG: phosphatase PAP2 family protein [Patescibacteria group bacterium]
MLTQLFQHIDLVVSQVLQSFQPSWLTDIARHVSGVCAPRFVVPALIVSLIVWWYSRQKHREAIQFAAVLTGNIFSFILKPLIERPRPVDGVVRVMVYEPTYSFPSGHALAIALGAGFLWLWSNHFSRPVCWVIRLVAIVAFLAVGWSRIYLGAHWLSDVVAGYAIGLLWVGAVWLYWPKVLARTLKKI